MIRRGVILGVHEDDVSFWGFFPRNIAPFAYRRGSLPVRLPNGIIVRGPTSYRLRNDLKWWSKMLPSGEWVQLSYWRKPGEQCDEQPNR